MELFICACGSFLHRASYIRQGGEEEKKPKVYLIVSKGLFTNIYKLKYCHSQGQLNATLKIFNIYSAPFKERRLQNIYKINKIH